MTQLYALSEALRLLDEHGYTAEELLYALVEEIYGVREEG